MSYSHNKRKKTFRPLVLYDSSRSSTTISADSNNTPIDQYQLIEEHRVKTRNMLEYNAHMWENEGRARIVSPDQSPSPQPRYSSHFSLDVQPNQLEISSHSNRSSMSYSDNQSGFLGKVEQHKLSPTVVNTTTTDVLEPQTQNTIPLPLYSHEILIRTPAEPSVTYASTSPPLHQELYHTETRSEEEEYEDEYDEEPFVQTTTFITEPQYHHTYKPQIPRKRRRGNLPKEVTEFLKHWLILHKKHPYPTEREKQTLADETGLMVNQISNWFINARRRILQPLLESESRQAQRAENSTTSRSVGVNVVGGSSNSSVHRSLDIHPVKVATTSGGNYYPHLHHNYTSNSAIDTSSLLLQQPTTEDPNSTELDRSEQRSSVPPPWVLLPTKLPSMNILEKDLEAFEPKD